MRPSQELAVQDRIYDCEKEIRRIESLMYDCRPSTKLAYQDKIYDLRKQIENARLLGLTFKL